MAGKKVVVAWIKRGTLQNTISFARISPTGELLDRVGRVLSTRAGEGWMLAVAANSEKALIVWLDIEDALQSALIDLDSGRVLTSNELDAPVSRNAVAAATNGQDFLVGYDKLKFLRVDGGAGSVFEGDVPRDRLYVSANTTFPSIAFIDGHYVATFVSRENNPTWYTLSVPNHAFRRLRRL